MSFSGSSVEQLFQSTPELSKSKGKSDSARLSDARSATRDSLSDSDHLRKRPRFSRHADSTPGKSGAMERSRFSAHLSDKPAEVETDAPASIEPSVAASHKEPGTLLPHAGRSDPTAGHTESGARPGVEAGVLTPESGIDQTTQQTTNQAEPGGVLSTETNLLAPASGNAGQTTNRAGSGGVSSAKTHLLTPASGNAGQTANQAGSSGVSSAETHLLTPASSNAGQTANQAGSSGVSSAETHLLTPASSNAGQTTNQGTNQGTNHTGPEAQKSAESSITTPNLNAPVPGVGSPVGSSVGSSVGSPMVQAVASPEKALEKTIAGVQQVGIVVDKFDQEARLTPVLLSLGEVNKVARSLLALGVKNPSPLQATDKEYAMQMAVEIFSVADALRGVLVQLRQGSTSIEAARESWIQLPASARTALEWLISLQTMLDTDSFAQTFGALPKLQVVNPQQLVLSPAQLAALRLDDTQQQAAWPVIFVRVNLTSTEAHPVAQNRIMTTTAPVLGEKATSRRSPELPSSLPSWLSDAKPVQKANVTYRPRRINFSSSAAVAETSAPPDASSDKALSVFPGETGTPSRSSRPAIDAQAELFRAQQRQQLPQKLRRLADFPATNSKGYPQWLGKMAVLVRETDQLIIPQATDRAISGRPAYVFDDNNVMRLLKMLPLAVLRDVIRHAAAPQSTEQTPLIEPHMLHARTLGDSEAAVGRVRRDSARLSERLSRRVDEVLQQAESPALRTVSTERHATRAEVAAPQPSASSVPLSYSDADSFAVLASASGQAALAQAASAQTKSGLQSQAANRNVRDHPESGRQKATPSAASTTHRAGVVTVSEAQAGGIRSAADLRTELSETMALRSSEAGALRAAEASASSETASREAGVTAERTATQAAQDRARRLAQFQQMARRIRAQVTQQILRQTRESASRVELQLNPRRLGKINIEIVQDSGKTAIRFVVENAETLQRLRDDAVSLIESLREAGVATDQGAMEFTLKEGNQQQAGEKRKKSSDDAPLEEEDGVLAPGEEAIIDDDGHVNVQV